MLVAIDGPAGAGKSTVARELARELGFSYLDSGALYRAVALLSLQEPDADPARLASEMDVALDDRTPAHEPGVLLDGHDVSADIRTPEVAAAASLVAADPAVRAILRVLHQPHAGECSHPARCSPKVGPGASLQ